jgi:hypothetical protein
VSLRDRLNRLENRRGGGPLRSFLAVLVDRAGRLLPDPTYHGGATTEDVAQGLVDADGPTLVIVCNLPDDAE